MVQVVLNLRGNFLFPLFPLLMCIDEEATYLSYYKWCLTGRG